MLRLAIRRGQRSRLAVLLYSAPVEKRSSGRCHGLKCKRVATFATGVSISALIKSMAAALWRSHSRDGHHHARPLAEDHVYADNQGGLALIVLHSAYAIVGSDYTRGAGRVDR
eukprot:scaffold25972_cov32-Tisochrysis_lutea.AAC.7